MKIARCLLLSSLLSCQVFAGQITIEKSDSLIRNDLFDAKKQRAREYKQYEAQRNATNQQWLLQLDPSCGLLPNGYLIYFCSVNGRYYKGYESVNRTQYRQLSGAEAKKIANEND